MTAAEAVATTTERASTPRPSRAIVLWTGGCLAAALAIVGALALHRGDAEGSARLANREMDALLAPDESVLVRVPVQGRAWWDWYRVSHGVLAATSRRLLYVGVPPEQLLPPYEDPVLEVKGVAYTSPLRVLRGRGRVRAEPTFTVLTTAGQFTVGVAAGHAARMASLLGAVAAQQRQLQLAAEAEREATQATRVAARRAITHLVQRGESLEAIAARYGTSADSLRAWNRLSDDRITAGRRLVVRPERGDA